MDPDVIMTSIEKPEPPAQNAHEYKDVHSNPLRQASPEKTPSRPSSRHTSPAPLRIPKSSSRASTPSRERQSTPTLHTKRSTSNLSPVATRNLTPSHHQSRRPSSNLNPFNNSPNGTSQVLQPEPLTAADVAKDYFIRELKTNATAAGKVLVIMHDSCFGHRFSRPKTSKAALSTIVERPERLLATLLGASTAYVRLGGRHAADRHGPHPDRDPSTATPSPLILRKTTRAITLNHPAVTNVHGTKWMEELQIMCDSAEAKLAMNGKELARPIGYGKDEAGNNLPKLHDGDLYLCSESLNALQGCLGGVCDAVDAVFTSNTTRRAFVNIRPPGHHCSSDFPSGFCWLNNVHVGVSYAAMNHNLTHAAIIDFDLHHGDGSQTIAWNHNQRAQSLPKNAAAHKKVPIGYYSLHDINSYPCEWGDEDKVRNASLCLQNAHGQSIWNVHLEPWKSLEQFWQLYESKYVVLFEKTRMFLQHHSGSLRRAGVEPKAAIFLSAGFDASQWESEGMQRHSVNVPTEFYARFTRDVVKLAEEQTLGVNGRVISVLEGGYSDRALTSGMLSHLCGLADEAITEVDSVNQTAPGVIGSMPHAASAPKLSKSSNYDPSWWSESQMTELEAMVMGLAPPPPPSKISKQPGNYSSPTQASTLRMSETARERQSLSAQLEARMSLSSIVTEPPPEVDWVTASYELSRLLIPHDRQTLSCRHDELNAEATRARRERQSLMIPSNLAEEKMQLRDRKARAVPPIMEDQRAASRSANRRTTIAAVSDLSDPVVLAGSRPRRRSSAASSVLSSFQGMSIDDNVKIENPPTSLPLTKKKAHAATATKQFRPRTNSRERGVEQIGVTTQAQATHGQAPPIKASGHGIMAKPLALPRQNSVGSTSQKDGIDELTNGMKKVSIKLKMPTQAVDASDKADFTSLPKAKAVRKPPVPRAPKVKSATAVKPAMKARGTKTVSASAIQPPVEMSQRLNENPQGFLPTDDGGPPALIARIDETLPSKSELPSMLNDIDRSVAEAGVQEDTVMQETSDTKSSDLQTDSKHHESPPVWVPDEQALPPRPEAPTLATTMRSQVTPVRRTKDDLPIFMATSPIPFSQNQSSASNVPFEQNNVHSVNK